MLYGFLILLAVNVIGFPSSALSDAVHGAASPVKRDASLPESGVNSDSSGGWYEFEDSITATKAVDGHAQKRDAQVETDVDAFAKRQTRSDANTIHQDTNMYQAQNALPLSRPEKDEDLTQNAEAELTNSQPQIQGSFKRSPNDYSNSARGNVASRTTHPVERGSPSNHKRQLSPETSMILNDIKMYQPYYALRPSRSENAETIEENPVTAISDTQSLSESSVQKRDIAVGVERTTESAIKTDRKRELRSESELVQHDIGAYKIPSALQATDTENTGAYEPSPDDELSEISLNSIEGRQTPIRPSLKATSSKIDFTNRATKRHLRQPLRGAKSFRRSSFQPFSESSTVIRRQNSPLPGDAMPLFLANYYPQRRCEHKHKCHKPKCSNCGNHYCEERDTYRPTNNAFHIYTNNKGIPRQSWKRNAELLPSYTQKIVEDAAQFALKNVVRRQENLHSSKQLQKPEDNMHVVRREALPKHEDAAQIALKNVVRRQENLQSSKQLQKPEDNVHVVRREALPKHEDAAQIALKNVVRRQENLQSSKQLQKPEDNVHVVRREALPKHEDAAQIALKNVVRRQENLQSSKQLQKPEDNVHVVRREALPKHEDAAQIALKNVVRRQENLQSSKQLQKPEDNVHVVRREALPKHFPSEMLKFELEYTQNKLKAKQNSLQRHVKRETKIHPLYDSVTRDGKLQLVGKRASSVVKREVKSFPMEMLKFELDYKKRSIQEKRKESPTESDMMDHDMKLYQPLDALQQSVSQDDVTFEENPESDTSNAQRSSNENGYIEKRDALKISEQPKERSVSSYGKTQLSPEASMMDSDNNMYGPVDVLQPTEPENDVTFEQSQENAIQFEQNPESDISNDEQSLQTTFLSNDNGLNQKRDTIKTSAEPMEKSVSSYGKTQLSPEASMMGSDINMYEPFDALQQTEPENDVTFEQSPENALTFEQNPESDISNDEESLQTTFKLSSNDNVFNQKRDTIKISEQPMERSASSYRKIRLNPEARMIDNNIKTYQPFYALQPTISENAGAFEQKPESAVSNDEESLQQTFKRNSDENDYNQNSDPIETSAQSKEISASSYGNIRFAPESSMIEHEVEMNQPLYALEPTESDKTEPFQQNDEAELSDAQPAQPLIQSSFERSSDDDSYLRKRDTDTRSHQRVDRGFRSQGKRKSSPEVDMVNRDIKLYQPYYALPPIESVNSENDENQEAGDSSVDQASLKSSFKRSSDDNSYLRKRDTDTRSHQRVERGFRSHGKRKSSPEVDMVNRDIKLYQPYYALPPIESVNSENDENQEAGDSSVDQASLKSSFKRSSEDNSHVRKRDTATRHSANRLERGSPYEKRESSPESEMVSRDIRLYQPYYALPLMESENAETLAQNPEAAVSSDAKSRSQYDMKRRFINNSSARKRGTLRRSTSTNERGVNLYGHRQLRL